MAADRDAVADSRPSSERTRQARRPQRSNASADLAETTLEDGEPAGRAEAHASKGPASVVGAAPTRSKRTFNCKGSGAGLAAGKGGEDTNARCALQSAARAQKVGSLV